MKKVIRLTESDLERIVRRVIKEQYAGVAFGAEQNGLQIRKGEFKEQSGQKSKSPGIMSKVVVFFPPTAKDPVTNQLTYNREADSTKYDNIIKFLMSAGDRAVKDPSTMTTIDNKQIKINNDRIVALYKGIESIQNNGYNNALKGLTQYGPAGESFRAMAAKFLDDKGIKYS